MGYPITVAQLTDIGLKRTENQDAIGCFYDDHEDVHLLIVADGMGGAACGSFASQQAVALISQTFFAADSRSLKPPKRLNRALIAANHEIWLAANDLTECKGMGATCVVLALLKQEAWLAHVGDSRIYHVADNRVIRLTRDHSHVQRLLEGGLISEEEAQAHPQRSRVERALGPRELVQPEVCTAPVRLQDGEAFLLCSDGLSSLVQDEEIFSIVHNAPAQQACTTLVELAKQRGGTDNISVAIAHIGDQFTRAF